jgi:hypothetical protein
MFLRPSQCRKLAEGIFCFRRVMPRCFAASFMRATKAARRSGFWLRSRLRKSRHWRHSRLSVGPTPLAEAGAGGPQNRSRAGDTILAVLDVLTA